MPFENRQRHEEGGSTHGHRVARIVDDLEAPGEDHRELARLRSDIGETEA